MTNKCPPTSNAHQFQKERVSHNQRDLGKFGNPLDIFLTDVFLA